MANRGSPKPRPGRSPPPAHVVEAIAAEAAKSGKAGKDPLTFTAKLWAPMEGKGWTFASLPPASSAALGKRGRVPVFLTLGGQEFRTSCFPDGKGGHLIQLNAAMREAAGKQAGDVVAFRLRLDTAPVKVSVPPGLARALRAHPGAQGQWEDITPKAKAMWIGWVAGAKQEATRQRRIEKAVEQLADGVRWPGN